MTLMNLVALAFIKTSCMLFFKRIFRTGTQKVFDALCYIYIFLTVGWCLSFFFAFLFTCGTNFDFEWGTVEQQLECPVNFVMVDQGMSYMDLILDVIILIFPFPYVCIELRAKSRRLSSLDEMADCVTQIWGLHLNATRKLLISFVFFLGSL